MWHTCAHVGLQVAMCDILCSQLLRHDENRKQLIKLIDDDYTLLGLLLPQSRTRRGKQDRHDKEHHEKDRQVQASGPTAATVAAASAAGAESSDAGVETSQVVLGVEEGGLGGGESAQGVSAGVGVGEHDADHDAWCVLV